MRCPDCNKFVRLEMSDPDVESLEVTHVGEADDPKDGEVFSVQASVRIVRCCAECGTEMKEATLDMEDEVILKTDHPDRVEIEENESIQIEEGGGRYAKSYFGAVVSYKLTADGKVVHEGTIEDKVAASHMDEMV